ncbi:crooked neck-like protein 1 [Tanacetum coccineum]
MSKAFRAKAKAEREIRGDHVLQYSMLRDCVVELQSTNPNTNVKITVETNLDPSLPTRVFQIIYVCLGALKLGFRACRRELLGLDGAFMFQAKYWQLLDLIQTMEFTHWPMRWLKLKVRFEGAGSYSGIIPAIKTVFPSVEHRYCLRHIHENMKQGWCGQAYKDLLWRSASATSVKEFEKYMLELKMMNPKAHEWLNKIPPKHWARSHFSGRIVFNGKIVRCRDKPVLILLEYIREYCMKRIVNVQSVIDKCTGPLTPTATKIMKSIKKEAHLMKVQWNRENKYQVSSSLGDQCVVDVVTMTCSCRKKELRRIPCKHAITACWNMALNDRVTPPLEAWVGRPKKKRKMSKHEDEPFVKDGKLSKKGRTITCQSCKNIGHNKETCKGQGRKPITVGQDGLGGSRVGVVISFSATDGQGGAGGARVGVGGEVPVSEIRNADGKEMGDGIPTQSSTAGGASFHLMEAYELKAPEVAPQYPEQAPLSPVPAPEYPEYLAPSDNDILAEDQPLPIDASPTTRSPGYIADSKPIKDDLEEDPEMDPVDYPSNEEDEE